MFKCHRCGKVLVSKQAYTYHMNRKKPCIITHDCTQCECKFRTKFDLSIHKLHCVSSSKDGQDGRIVVEMNGDKVLHVRNGVEYINFDIVQVE